MDISVRWTLSAVPKASLTLELKSPQNVHIGVNEKLELNCTSNRPIHDLRPAKLLWQHNKVWIPNNTYVVDDYTVQLKITKTSYGDAGCYSCGLFNISSNSHSTNPGYSPNVTVIVGEKPNKPNLTLVSAFGKPVQELTLQWSAKVSASYELLLGRVKNGSIPCSFDNVTAISIKNFQGSKRDGFLSYHVTREVLGKLFTRDELYKTGKENCVFQVGTKIISKVRCDRFCAYVVAKNGFGTSQSQLQVWNLINHARCPSPANLNVVVINDHSIKLRWQRPSLVSGQVYYKLVAVTVTSVLTGKTFSIGTTLPLIAIEAVSHTIEGQVNPYTTYRFWVSCCFSPVCDSEGPPAFTKVVTQEIAPSGKPICEVRNRSSDGQAYVMVKLPPKETWNGIPKRIALHYGSHQKISNVSHEELVHLNRSLEIQIHVNGLDVYSNYSVTAAFCTVGGCGNYSSPCLMYALSKDSIEKAVEGLEKKKWKTWKVVVSVAVGLFVGIVLVLIVYSCWIKRRRSRGTRNIQPLGTIFKNSSLNSVHAYENHVDDGPKVCEESSNYDRLRTGSTLLKDEDCTLGNISVSKI
ncbi:unnamed protein product [Porites evermanni]|uniref:Uncharacterized protein n=1 Tax=Porites evermanni TaxID=104178 RepID=A0ABN8LQP8_9CNID|nr:unnamed protein product [Porites evermanni]